MLKGFINAKVRWPDQHSEFSDELHVFTRDPQFEASFQWHGDIGCWLSVSDDSWLHLTDSGVLDAISDVVNIRQRINIVTAGRMSAELMICGFQDCTRFGDVQDVSKHRVYIHVQGGDKVEHFDNAEAAKKFYKQTAKRGVKCALRVAKDATPVEDWKE